MFSIFANPCKLLPGRGFSFSSYCRLSHSAFASGTLRGLVALFLLASHPATAADDPYKLNPGDEILISVWKETDLQREVLVLPDGTVGFPLAGHVKAEGLTPKELERAIAKRLRKFVPDALVTVSVLKAAGNKIYIIGEVNKPGEYQPSRKLNVMQALSLAGGLTAYASESRIIVLRRVGEQKVSLPFPYADLQKGEKLNKNFELMSGDTVVVPGRSLF